MLSVRGLARADLPPPGLGPLDLDVPAGAVVALMGASGSGKSVLLRAIADLDAATGTVCLEGRDRATLPAPEWRRRVLYVAADAGWWDDRVRAHFADVAAAAALLPRLGLPAEALDWPVDRLSTGERQRLALARAVTLPRQGAPGDAAAPPPARIYLLDEPTAALDAGSRARVEEVIAALPDARTAVLLVTHDGEQARRMAGVRTLTLRDGKLGDADTILEARP